MKKSLSVILSSAMALSMFSSVAFGATSSADFNDLKDLDAATKAKFDAMISAGIFDGVADKEFGLKDKMNRAQFAKVAALIFGLKVDTSVKTSSFTDVDANDASNGYALPYIEAAYKAGLTDGFAPGQFNPAGDVTKEQLATFLVRGLGKDAEGQATPGVSDITVSDWAKGYVALALQLKLLSTNADGSFGGTFAATRDLLVLGAFEAKAQYDLTQVPAKASVSSVKATGAQKVEVTLNKEVDSNATFTLKKGTISVVTTATLSADKKTATLALTDTKLSAGEYTVTLGGVSEIDKASASFTAEDEKVAKIDFVNAGDTVADNSNSAIVKIKASNQYGENASISAGSYTVYTSSVVPYTLRKDTDGTLLLKLNTTDVSLQANISIIPVNIVHNDTRVSASKNFKVGTESFITKLELGEAKYSAGKSSISGTGENAIYTMNLYDQYGNVIGYDNNKFVPSDVKVIFNQYEPNLDYAVEENSESNMPQLKIKLKANVEKSGDYNFTIYNQAATATGVVKVNSTKIANKVEIGDFDNVLAAGDQDVYIPVVAYDANGNQLSIEDLTSDDNVQRIGVTVSGATPATYTVNGKTATIQQSGEHKGSIKLNSVDVASKGIVSITTVIATPGANSIVTKTFNVADIRVPDRLRIVDEVAQNTVKGGTDKFKYTVLDQHGKELKNSRNTNGSGNLWTTGDQTTYEVQISAINPVGTGLSITQDNDAAVTTPYTGTALETFNKGFKVQAATTASNNAQIDVVAKIVKKINGAGAVDIASITKTIKVVEATADINYGVGNLGDVFNAIDSASVTNYVYGSGTGETVTIGDQENPAISKLAKEIKLTATNAAGETVAVRESGAIKSVFSSNTAIAQVAIASNGKAYVLGNKVGTANVTITFETPKGEQKTATVAVNVKADAVAVASIESKTEITLTNAALASTGGVNAFTAAEVKAFDNYGLEYKQLDAQTYNYLLGISFSVTNIRGTAGVSVTVDKYGMIKVNNGTVTSFDLTINSASGKSVSTSVVVNP